MQIPIVKGIYTDNGPDIRTAYPVNLMPVVQKSGISDGYLRPADGVVHSGYGPGIDRGGINWRGQCYRVMGSKLCTVDAGGVIVELADVGNLDNSLVSMDYSFDRLAIASDGKLFYWNGSIITEVVDADLGVVIDLVWVDGYFMTTDGNSLIVTELNDPTQVNPLKYGSSEVDPDPVIALRKIKNEVYAVNRNTIEVFDNVGGDLFPFQRIDGAQITKGAVGTRACCVFMDTVAFVGSGRNESPSVYLGNNGAANKISTQEIDILLASYTESEIASVLVEARNDRNHQHLYVHLPDRTVVYDGLASQELGEHVWFVLTSSTTTFSKYRARNMVWANDRWLVSDPTSNAFGYFDESTGEHWGDKARWEFGTMIAYNEGKGAIFNQLELVSLTGRIRSENNPYISTSYSLDGQNWSQEKSILAGSIGSTRKRLAWFQQGSMRNFRIQRFRGDTDAHLSFARLEAQIEALAY